MDMYLLFLRCPATLAQTQCKPGSKTDMYAETCLASLGSLHVQPWRLPSAPWWSLRGCDGGPLPA